MDRQQRRWTGSRGGRAAGATRGGSTRGPAWVPCSAMRACACRCLGTVLSDACMRACVLVHARARVPCSAIACATRSTSCASASISASASLASAAATSRLLSREIKSISLAIVLCAPSRRLSVRAMMSLHGSCPSQSSRVHKLTSTAGSGGGAAPLVSPSRAR